MKRPQPFRIFGENLCIGGTEPSTMRIKNTQASTSAGTPSREAELDAPPAALRTVRDGFEAPRARGGSTKNVATKSVTPTEPKLVKVEGQTPTYQKVNAQLVDGGISVNVTRALPPKK